MLLFFFSFNGQNFTVSLKFLNPLLLNGLISGNVEVKVSSCQVNSHEAVFAVLKCSFPSTLTRNGVRNLKCRNCLRSQ